jgi:hypothetical protein
VLARRLLAASVLIASLALPVAAGLAADGVCQDDCDPYCGDCALCAGVAALAPAPAVHRAGPAGAVCAARTPPSPLAPPRPIGHVPLAAR